VSLTGVAADRGVVVYPYLRNRVRRLGMEAASKLTTKGQITIPKAVRDALGLTEGDSVVFRVEGQRAVLARTADLLELAGTVSVPAAKRGVTWDEIRWRTRAARSSSRG
jgi:antitoxin PrlF